ncbi:MAG: alpha/beta family hydrolase [Candidatus Nanopelagicales bacterium]
MTERMPIVSEVWDVDTPTGMARAHYHRVPHGRPRSTLVLGHGIGRGVNSPDLREIAAALPEEGIEVVLVEQPWRVLGKRLGGSSATLDAAWTAVIADLRSRGLGVRRLVVGGRSSGARVAARTIVETNPDAYLALAFPLYPARRSLATFGRTPASRLPELVAAAREVPTVVVQGARDNLGTAVEIASSLTAEGVAARVVPVPYADHIWAVPAKAPGGRQAALALVVRASRATALRLREGPY